MSLGSVTYEMILIPCGISTGGDIPVSIISYPVFPEGSYSNQDIREALTNNPIFKYATGIELIGAPLSDWLNKGRFDTATSWGIKAKHSNDTQLSVLLERQIRYLRADSQNPLSGPRNASRIVQDRSLDKQSEEDFVDLGAAYEMIVQRDIALSRAAEVSLRGGSFPSTIGTMIEQTSYQAMNYFAAATYSKFIESLPNFESPDAKFSAGMVHHGYHEYLKVRKEELENNSATLDAKRAAFEANTESVEILNKRLDEREPNTLIHSALACSPVAYHLGFVTKWVISRADLKHGVGSHAIGQQYAGVTSWPTACYLGNMSYPASYRNDNARSDLLWPIKGRFRAIPVAIENELQKMLVSQYNAPDPQDGVDGGYDGTPQILATEGNSASEPQTRGMSFVLPKEDFVLPNELRDIDTREQRKLGIFFNEDLRIGFRLDTCPEKESSFKSIHTGAYDISFDEDIPNIHKYVGEDFAQINPGSAEDAKYRNIALVWDGLNSAQKKLLQDILGGEGSPRPCVKQPFTIIGEAVVPDSSYPLLVGNINRYRCRTVFIGGVGASVEEANEAGAVMNEDSPPKPDWIDTFQMTRTDSFKVGQLLFEYSKELDESGELIESNDGIIILNEKNRKQSIVALPHAIDFDTARLYDMIARCENELDRFKGWVFQPERALLDQHIGKRGITYFPDPHVHGIHIVCDLLNGDPNASTRDMTYKVLRDGRMCTSVKHHRFVSEQLYFGNTGEWDSFRPLQIDVVAGKGHLPSFSVRRRGGLTRMIKIQIPEAGEVNISIWPIFDAKLFEKTNFIHNVNPVLTQQQRNEGVLFPASPPLAVRMLKVINTTPKPLFKPVFIADTRYVGAQKQAAQVPLAVALHREVDQTHAQFQGRLVVDSPSTGSIHFEGSYTTINDNPRQPFYAVEEHTVVSKSRSVIFRSEDFVDKKDIIDRALAAKGPTKTALQALHKELDLQCMEDEVMMNSGVLDIGDDRFSQRPDLLPIADSRRVVIKGAFIATTRFTSSYTDRQIEENRRVSDAVVFDAPNAGKLDPVLVSHAIPISKESVNKEPGRGEVYTKEHGVRVYMHRPCFKSGPCERVAVGCSTAEAVSRGASYSVNRFISQWGEDLFSWPHYTTTRRLPTASDFSVPGGLDGFSDKLDPTLYPPGSFSDIKPISIYDNVEFVSDVSDLDARFDDASMPTELNLASYALRFDTAEKLWFIDIVINDPFSGWLGLALYRHQPHAVHGRKLSTTATWIYTTVLEDHPIAVLRRNDRYHVTVGPVYDNNVRYGLATALGQYTGTVTDALKDGEIKQMVRTIVGRAFYFMTPGIEAFTPGECALIKMTRKYEIQGIKRL